MNVERIRELADVIEKQPHTSIPERNGFCMSNYVHNCGTPACIAGWAVATKLGVDRLEWNGDQYEEAVSFLGITHDDSDRLFSPSEGFMAWQDIKPHHAAAVLRHLAETGDVDWHVGAPVTA